MNKSFYWLKAVNDHQQLVAGWNILQTAYVPFDGQFIEVRVPTLQNVLYIRDDGVRA